MEHFGVATLCHISRSQEQRNMACDVLVRCAFGNVYPRLICHELVQYFKVATFPFKDDCTAAHVLRSSATHFSIVKQDYTYLKKGFYRNYRAHEEVKIIIRTDDIVAEN